MRKILAVALLAAFAPLGLAQAAPKPKPVPTAMSKPMPKKMSGMKMGKKMAGMKMASTTKTTGKKPVAKKKAAPSMMAKTTKK